MKIVYVTNDVYGQGGVARILSVKSTYMINQFNYQIEIISTSKASTPFYKFLPSVSLKHIPVSGRYFFDFVSYFMRLKKEITKAKPDCVVICDNGIKGHLLSYIDLKAPVVFESHAIDLVSLSSNKFFFSPFLDRLKKCLIKHSLKRVNRHVVLSKSAADLFGSKYAVVIPNPIWLHPKTRRVSNSKKVIAVGRLIPTKGYDRMLRIWKKIHQTHPDWKLDVYGEGSCKNQLLKQIEWHNLNNIVNLKGSSSNIENLYQDYAFLIHTSFYESFSLVLVEAMASGLPVVSFDCPLGPREIISDNEDGFLVEENDEETYIQRIIDLMTDDVLLNQMGQKAYNNMRRFEIKAVMRQWQDLFDGLKRDYYLVK